MEFQLFRRFTQELEIDEISETLQSNNIVFKISNPVSQWDTTLGSTDQIFFELYIRQKDFASVKQILEKRAEAVAQSISPDYYLFTFSDSELQNILSNPNDWNELDIFLSKQILTDRESNSRPQKTEPTSIYRETEKSISFEKKDSLRDHFKYYSALIITTLIGVVFTLYVKAYHPEITDTHIALVIATLVTVTVLYYENKHTCPKCNEKFNTERLHRLEQGDIAMPRPYNVLERFKCHNCGKVWDEFSEESRGD